MSGVSGLLVAVGTPFLFILSIFLLPLTPVLAAESPITDSSVSESLIAESSINESLLNESSINEIPVAESLIEAESVPFDENPAYGPEDDQSGMSAVSEIAPFQEPIEENGDLSPGAITPGMEGIEGQYQMQLLQSEVMELRGLLEELTFHFERMRSMQEDRYLELDKRFQSLSQGGVDTGGSSNVQPGTTDPYNGAGSTQAPGQDEKTLYETALELIRNRQYDLAITQLEEVIAQFPDGTYAPNAYYWLGEVYAAKPSPDYEKARQALAQVISFFPDHRKVPDAAFKLGKVYNLMGDCARARDILNQVIEQHKGKSVSKLAESYLRDNVNCEKQ
jgi:tol-pal system protein YbgF